MSVNTVWERLERDYTEILLGSRIPPIDKPGDLVQITVPHCSCELGDPNLRNAITYVKGGETINQDPDLLT